MNNQYLMFLIFIFYECLSFQNTQANTLMKSGYINRLDKVIVAIIDTGMDQSHENGFQIFGWDFTDNQPNPTDENGHGTHIAGIIRSTINLYGTKRNAHSVLIMPLKYYSKNSSGLMNLNHSVLAIHYAIDHGARIINYSGGGHEFSQDEYEAIQEANTKGILFVTAAGNESQNTDIQKNYYYPSAYHFANLLSVAAIDQKNQLLPFSNWGAKTVHLAALGDRVRSTLPHGLMGTMTGTSQATAFVTGLAAVLLAKNKNLTVQELKSIILSSTHHYTQLEKKLISGGTINPQKALKTLAMQI